MSLVLRGWCLIAGLTFSVGCGGGVAAKFDAFADRMCACDDEACASAVMEEFLTYAEETRKSTTREERKAATPGLERLQTCYGDKTKGG